MKFYTFFVIFYLFTSVRGDDIINEPVKLKDIIKMKCEKISGEEAYPFLLSAMYGSRLCINKLKESKEEESFQEYCDDPSISDAVYECVKPINDKLLDCLEEEEAYLPDFLWSALNFSLKQFCGDEGEKKLEYVMESLADTQCFSNNFNTQKMANDCLPSFAIFKIANSSDLSDKSFTEQSSDICLDVVNLQSCVDKSIKEQCFGKDHSKMVEYLLEPFLSLCNKKA